MPPASRELREVAAAFLCGLVEAGTVVHVAAELLPFVPDDSAVLPIAVLPPRPDAVDLRALLHEVFADAGDSGSLTGDTVRELALRFGFHSYLDGLLDAQTLIRWSRSPYPPEPASFTTLWWIGENFHDGVLTDDELEQQLTEAAHQFLASTQDLAR